MATKRQTTMAKLQRERKVQEKRERKREKKAAVAAAQAARPEDTEKGRQPAEPQEATPPHRQPRRACSTRPTVIGSARCERCGRWYSDAPSR